jgi:hypothetical protein
MASRRRNAAAVEPRPPEYAICNFYAMADISPAFDPNRVLLRRVFFTDEDKTGYISVGFYPARNYQPLVEFGHIKREKPTILVLNDRHVKTLTEILPRICEFLCRVENYEYSDRDFRLNTTPGWLVAKMTLNKKFISLRLVELQHLSRMFHVVQNQLDAYTNAMPAYCLTSQQHYLTPPTSNPRPTPVSISCTRNCTRNSRQFYYK